MRGDDARTGLVADALDLVADRLDGIPAAIDAALAPLALGQVALRAEVEEMRAEMRENFKQVIAGIGALQSAIRATREDTDQLQSRVTSLHSKIRSNGHAEK